MRYLLSLPPSWYSVPAQIDHSLRTQLLVSDMLRMSDRWVIQPELAQAAETRARWWWWGRGIEGPEDGLGTES